MTAFARATRPEQKESRRAQLLTTARAMLSEGTTLQSLSLNELARRADMTKSNVYRYFESREHVLVEMLQDEWALWLDAFTSTWPQRTTLKTLACHLAHTLAARPLLCELCSALPSVLEHNLSADAIAHFKRSSLAFLTTTAALVARKTPELTERAALRLLNDTVIVVTGLWPHANPAPAVVEALRSSSELCVFEHDFEAELAEMLHALMRR